MRILVISTRDGDSFDLAWRMMQEGHDVKIAVQAKEDSGIGEGFGIKRVTGWRKELPWVGKKGLIVFDHTGFGKIQDKLRRAGYSVFGGSEGGDRLELERHFAQDIFSRHGIKTVPSLHFSSTDQAIAFIKKNRRRWVLKQNGQTDKTFSYCGKLNDGSDVINLLENYHEFNHKECQSVDLQKWVSGVELAVARYFNGQDWVGPIIMTMEHKDLFPGRLGPKTGEMGTLMWLEDDEQNKLFTETIAKVAPHLREVGFRGCFDINCIVSRDGPVPLEATPRFGYPEIHLNGDLMASPWSGFLKAIAEGKKCDVKWRRGFGVVLVLAVPPFPYESVNSKYNPKGLAISFRGELSSDDWRHIHFSEVSKRRNGGKQEEYQVSSDTGHVMCITGVAESVEEARKHLYNLAEKISIPRMFYRNDIGLQFIEKDRALLEKWGYLSRRN